MSSGDVNAGLEHLVDYIRDNRGFDFTGYKRASLERRIRKRMQEVAIAEYGDYQDYLQVHPDEFTQLFNTILINVTSFYRDPAIWEYVVGDVVPRVLERKAAPQQVRIWSVGCASGEEAYTVAMIMAEAVGARELRGRVKIYATDVDDEALALARAGAYSQKSVEPIPEDLRAKYLEPASDNFAFKKEIRRAVIFGRHDLVQDAPISRVDLIVCRNTLMYFNSDAQSRIYRGFHFALNPEGFLFLGKSEMLLTRTDMFMPLDLRRRLFMRAPASDDPKGPIEGQPSTQGEAERLRIALFDTSLNAQLVLDDKGSLVSANDRARVYFGVGDGDLGKAFHDLELSYRPVELRSRIDQVRSSRRASVVAGVPWATVTGDQIVFDVEVLPLVSRNEVLGVSISFADVTQAHEMRGELERSRRELETAYEEIQSSVEELETTNEELQSTNEELETTNEELQSTNEELETMNEELQSTNEELETINTELEDRTRQLNQTNLFFGSILESLRAGVVVLGSDLSVESWNSHAEELWGLRSEEVRGKNLFTLDIGLPVDQLAPTIRECMSSPDESAEIVVDARDRRGRSFRCKVVCSPMRDDGGNHHGVILLMEPTEDVATV
jgi:two-component system CheB/CheR fusion protein